MKFLIGKKGEHCSLILLYELLLSQFKKYKVLFIDFKILAEFFANFESMTDAKALRIQTTVQNELPRL